MFDPIEDALTRRVPVIGILAIGLTGIIATLTACRKLRKGAMVGRRAPNYLLVELVAQVAVISLAIAIFLPRWPVCAGIVGLYMLCGGCVGWCYGTQQIAVSKCDRKHSAGHVASWSLIAGLVAIATLEIVTALSWRWPVPIMN